MCPWIFRYLHTQISTVYLRFEHLLLTHRVVIASNKEGGPHHEAALQTADSQSQYSNISDRGHSYSEK